MQHAFCPRLAGCALVLLAATAPAMAGASTQAERQAEREATRQLNLQASQEAQVATARLMPQAMDASTPGAPPAAAPSAPIQTAAVETPAAPVTVPTTATAQTEPSAPATLSAISNPPAKIATANVLDSDGKTIGAVQKVEVTATGTPTRVTVALVGKQEKVVTLDAATVRYDAARNEITTALSGEQLKAQL